MIINHRHIIPIALLIPLTYLFGPRADLSYEIEPVNIREDIDQQLYEMEKQHADIKTGTEKKIIWANPESKSATPFSIVYLHGFSASRQEIAPLCDLLANKLSANLFYTRLTGHGRSSNAMRSVTVNSLLNDANEALEIGKKIGNKVILVGTSTGGSLATWLASQKQNNVISAVVLLSPNFGLKRRESEIMLYPWGKQILHLIEGEEYQFEAVNDQHKHYWTTRYPSEALLGMMGIVDLTRQMAFENISIPSMIFYSPNDQIIDINEVVRRYEQMGSTMKEITAIDNSSDPQQHILAGNILSPGTTGEIAEKISKFLAPIVNR